MSESDVPWAALYRRAIACGIGDDAFWRMSPAALIEITSGMKTMQTRCGAGPHPSRLRRSTFPRGEGSYTMGGSLTDCP